MLFPKLYMSKSKFYIIVISDKTLEITSTGTKMVGLLSLCRRMSLCSHYET